MEDEDVLREDGIRGRTRLRAMRLSNDTPPEKEVEEGEAAEEEARVTSPRAGRWKPTTRLGSGVVAWDDRRREPQRRATDMMMQRCVVDFLQIVY